jgi:UDP-2,4-diacetamido-2,4,6-trideoxy-beta-L-altropyranose hydrolase
VSGASTIELRSAEAGDRDLLYRWVNQPDSLANKLRTSGPIAQADHAAWFGGVLDDPDFFFWIIEAEGRPAGQVRFTPTEYGHEIDIYVDSGHRRRGVALMALALAASAFAEEHGPGRLVARVRPSNSPSRGLFRRAGFRLAVQASDHEVYELEAKGIRSLAAEER